MNFSKIKSELLKLPLNERQRLISEIDLKDKEELQVYSCQYHPTEVLQKAFRLQMINKLYRKYFT